jgi:hypothetical protein
VKNRHLLRSLVQLLFFALLIFLVGILGNVLLIAALGGGWHSPIELLTELVTGWTIGRLSVFLVVCIPVSMIIGFGIGVIIRRHLRSD